jgi:hypothetical protein
MLSSIPPISRGDRSQGFRAISSGSTEGPVSNMEVSLPTTLAQVFCSVSRSGNTVDPLNPADKM